MIGTLHLVDIKSKFIPISLYFDNQLVINIKFSIVLDSDHVNV